MIGKNCKIMIGDKETTGIGSWDLNDLKPVQNSKDLNSLIYESFRYGGTLTFQATDCDPHVFSYEDSRGHRFLLKVDRPLSEEVMQGFLSLSYDEIKAFLIDRWPEVAKEFEYLENPPIYSVVVIEWADPATSYRVHNFEFIEDRELIQKVGWKQLNFTAYGCTSKDQAIRKGKLILSLRKNGYNPPENSHPIVNEHGEVTGYETIIELSGTPGGIK